MPKKQTDESSRVQHTIRRAPIILGDIQYHTIDTKSAIKKTITRILENSDKIEVLKSKYLKEFLADLTD